MNLRYIQVLLNQILCDIKVLQENIGKKLAIYFNSEEVEDDVSVINFTGTGVQSVTTVDGVTTVDIEGGGGAQVQSDWTETNTLLPDYIQNKPTPIDLVFTGNVTTTQTGPTEITVDILGGGTPNLQEVTDVGSITTNIITTPAIDFPTVYGTYTFKPVPSDAGYVGPYLVASKIGLSANSIKLGNINTGIINATNLTTIRNLQLPNSNGTFANSVTVNTTNYTADVNGVIDIGTIGGSSGWGLTGNAGTTSGTNFIGTTDDIDFVIKRNSIQVAIFYPTNTFIGDSAGVGVSSTSNSNFIGLSAGYNASNSSNSNFIGNNAGGSSSDGGNSNFIGWGAGANSITGNSSNFIGNNAGANTIDAIQSNFIGIFAGNNADYATGSNFIGSSAGSGATSAESSNFIGTESGFGATSSVNSTFLGYRTGYNASGASYSNLIGFQVGKTFTANTIGSNNIIIGTNISLPNATTNAMNLGGVLFATGMYSNTTGEPSIVPVSTGKVGVGIVNPTSQFHVFANNSTVGYSLGQFENSNNDGLAFLAVRHSGASPISVGVSASGNNYVPAYDAHLTTNIVSNGPARYFRIISNADQDNLGTTPITITPGGFYQPTVGYFYKDYVRLGQATTEANQVTFTTSATVGVGTFTPTAIFDVRASTTSLAQIRLRAGATPSAPNDGDIWFDGTDIKMRIGGSTKTFTLV